MKGNLFSPWLIIVLVIVSLSWSRGRSGEETHADITFLKCLLSDYRIPVKVLIEI